MSLYLKSDSIQIREVWDCNLEAEMRILRDIIDAFPYVAMDTEFPGTVLHPITKTLNTKSPEYQYQSIKTNVNILKLIQLGLTLTDEHGNLPTCGSNKYFIWQFNFKDFNKETEPYNIESLHLLTQSGIDFNKFNSEGIDSNRFAELLVSSGLVLNPDVEWITFHGGYDFGYLLKVLTGQLLPATRSGFLEVLKTYFPVFYDVKHLMIYSNDYSLYGGLNKVAELLKVERIGVSHQAGSDSLLTSRVFMKMKRVCFHETVIVKHSGVLFGLDENRERM